jgi:putative membrane-bound dehydrogenase-like protein
MDFDEYGRIFVVEMPGYPLDTSGTGRVKLLEDTDGDGRPDSSTTFADKLVLPTGIIRWKKGVLVTDPPNVLYLEDTDGDNRADRREVILTGFAVTNPQHTVNTPLYGLDNWIYVAHESPARTILFPEKFGDRGGSIRFADQGGEQHGAPRPDAAQKSAQADDEEEDPARNVRFRPETHQVELLSGSSQFGHAFDAWGHHFTLNNSNHLRHEVIGPGYLQRNPNLIASRVMQDVSDHGNASPVFPITRNPQHQMLTDIGQFTSACSLTWYLGGLFGARYANVCFVAEPVHNLVHADVLAGSGTTFTARRLTEGSEFLSSTDSWFRPVNLYVGPEGALYLVDYYRQIIEHPEWMSREVNQSKDLYQGIDRGRIFRIVPDSPQPAAFPGKVRLGNASDAELIRQLGSSNIWMRRTVQRLLIDRRTPEVDALVQLFKASESPFTRLHALWTLEGLNKLPQELIESALGATEPGIRENAIRLAENHLHDFTALPEKLISMATDPDARVRLQLLCTLGNVDSPKARAARQQLLFAHVEDEWMQLAGLSGAGKDAYLLFERAVSVLASHETKARASFFRLVCADIAARASGNERHRVIEKIAANIRQGTGWWRSAGLEGLAEGSGDRRESTQAVAGVRADQDLLLSLFADPDRAVRGAALHLLQQIGLPKDPAAYAALTRAAEVAANPEGEAQLRADSIRLLRIEDVDKYQPLWTRLLSPHEPEEVQAAAAGALARVKDAGAVKLLIDKWKAMTAPVRMEAGDGFFRNSARLELLVKALKQGSIQPWTLSERHRRRLIMNPDPVVRETVRDLLRQAVSDREKVLQKYKPSLEEQGDVSNGAQVFRKNCSKCHQINGSGGKFGPDLNPVRSHAPEILLTDILIPGKAIAQNYEVYVIELQNGGLVDGTIAAQTPTAITLRHEDGREEVVLRKNIKEARASAVSGMPGDLEKQIDVRQMADLLAFLRGRK